MPSVKLARGDSALNLRHSLGYSGKAVVLMGVPSRLPAQHTLEALRKDDFHPVPGPALASGGGLLEDLVVLPE